MREKTEFDLFTTDKGKETMRLRLQELWYGHYVGVDTTEQDQENMLWVENMMSLHLDMNLISHLCGMCGNEVLGKTVTWAGDGHGQLGGS